MKDLQPPWDILISTISFTITRYMYIQAFQVCPNWILNTLSSHGSNDVAYGTLLSPDPIAWGEKETILANISPASRSDSSPMIPDNIPREMLQYINQHPREAVSVTVSSCSGYLRSLRLLRVSDTISSACSSQPYAAESHGNYPWNLHLQYDPQDCAKF